MGNTIELLATGEKITFLSSSTQSIEMIVTLQGSGDGPPAHRHKLQEEFFVAIEGRLGLDCGDKKIILEPGESFTIPANTSHRCYAVDGKEIRFKATFTPTLHIEYFLTEMFAACNRNQSKDPKIFDACYILRQMKNEYGLEGVPPMVQALLFPVISFIGKAFRLVKARSLNDWKAS